MVALHFTEIKPSRGLLPTAWHEHACWLAFRCLGIYYSALPVRSGGRITVKFTCRPSQIE